MDEFIGFIIAVGFLALLVIGGVVLHERLESNYDKCLDECIFSDEEIESKCISDCNYVFYNKTISKIDANCVTSDGGSE